MQERCLTALNQLKGDTAVRGVMVDMFEKMDYETYGHDLLEKLMSEITGEV